MQHNTDSVCVCVSWREEIMSATSNPTFCLQLSQSEPSCFISLIITFTTEAPCHSASTSITGSHCYSTVHPAVLIQFFCAIFWIGLYLNLHQPHLTVILNMTVLGSPGLWLSRISRLNCQTWWLTQIAGIEKYGHDMYHIHNLTGEQIYSTVHSVLVSVLHSTH